MNNPGRANDSQAHHPHLATRECEELDDWSAAVGWEVNYHQIGKGKFDAWFDLSLCHDLKVVDQYCNRETVGVGVAPKGHVALLISYNEESRGIFQGKSLGECDVTLMGPNTEGIYQTPPDLRMMTLHLPITRLGNAFQTMAGAKLEPLLCETRVKTLTSKIINRLKSIGREVIKKAPGASAVAPPDVYQQELEESFVSALIAGLTEPAKSEPGIMARKNRVQYVTAAREYIEAHLDRALGLETLARKTGVSTRTLEYAFREVLDTTPLRYVKARRLHAARHRLLNSDNGRLMVTDVALAFGFNHLSYFSRDYYALFGEYPFETLQAHFLRHALIKSARESDVDSRNVNNSHS